MGIFRKVFMQAAGVNQPPPESHFSYYDDKRSYHRRMARLDERKKELTENTDRFDPIPAMPADIRLNCGKETEGSKKNGPITQMASNPPVIIGMALTTLALLGMMKSSFVGDKIGTQAYMQYRIMAQMFTVTALATGAAFFGTMYDAGEEH
uniref:HIG1 domain-containing protein n=1 Tax=Steinernema glaseri TaxID=37863 RepID=A0A1I8AH35_9BILA